PAGVWKETTMLATRQASGCLYHSADWFMGSERAERPRGGKVDCLMPFLFSSSEKNFWSARFWRSEWSRYFFQGERSAIGSWLMLSAVRGSAGGFVPMMAEWE